MIRKIIYTFIVTTITVTSYAQELLSIDQCRELALQNNKQIQQAHQQTANAEYTAKSYKALYFPNFKLRAAGLYSTAQGNYQFDLGALETAIGGLGQTIGGLGQLIGGLVQFHPEMVAQNPELISKLQQMSQLGPVEMPGIGLDYEVGPMFMAGVTLEQPIFMGGKIKAANEMAKAGVEMAQKNDELVRSNVIADVDNAYALAVKANEMLKVAKSYNEILVELMQNVESAYRNGLKQKNDVMKVSVKLSESELNIRKAENAQRLSQMNLCHIIGRPLDSRIEVSSEYPEVGASAGSDDISSRPEYSILNQRVMMAEKQANIEKSSAMPEIGLLAAGSYMNGFELNGSKLFNDFSGSVMLNISVPLFHFGENSNKIKAAKAKVEMARYERENLNEQMQLQLTQAANNLDEARLEASLSDKNLEQAAENMRLSFKQYKAEMETLSDYLEAQTLWQQANAARVEAHFKLYLADVEYKKAAGKL